MSIKKSDKSERARVHDTPPRHQKTIAAKSAAASPNLLTPPRSPSASIEQRASATADDQSPPATTTADSTRAIGHNRSELRARLARVQQMLTDVGWCEEVSQSLPWGAVRGMPERADLFKLARIYLETQRKLWPELADTGVLLEVTEDNVAGLAGEFVVQFLDKRVQPFKWPDNVKRLVQLGTSYLRYSSSQQNPRSLDDQLVVQLTRAKKDNVFIPWHYVFADAGVTGTMSARTGYHLAKEALDLGGASGVDVIYVDQLSRATRDCVEALLLWDLVQNLGKRIIGVSDGIDSREEHSKIKMHFLAMFNEQFITQHRQQVLRGRNGAIRRGTMVGKLPLGLRAVPAQDKNGQPLLGRRGDVAHAAALDDEGRRVIEYLARRVLDDRITLHKVSREANRVRLGGRVSWCPATIKKMLQNEIYAGVVIHNRIKHVVDPATGKVRLVTRPRKEWKVTRAPHLAIFTWRRWKHLQARLKEMSGTRKSMYQGRSRNTVHPTTLVSGTLFCGYCGGELKLYRSKTATNTRNFHCRNGRVQAHGCRLNTSKSLTIIENCLLCYIRGTVLTPERIEKLVTRANEYLKAEAKKPRVDTRPLQRALADLRRKRDRLIDLIADGRSPDLTAIPNRIRSFEAEMKVLNGRLQEAQAANAAAVPPVDLARTVALLGDMRTLVNQDVPVAAPVLRQLVGGKIWVRLAEDPKLPPKSWVATFRSNIVPLIAQCCEGKPDYPDSLSWVNLKQRNWTQVTQETAHLHLPEAATKHFADKILRLVDMGMSVADASRQLGIPLYVGWDAGFYGRHGMTKGEAQTRGLRFPRDKKRSK